MIVYLEFFKVGCSLLDLCPNAFVKAAVSLLHQSRQDTVVKQLRGTTQTTGKCIHSTCSAGTG